MECLRRGPNQLTSRKGINLWRQTTKLKHITHRFAIIILGTVSFREPEKTFERTVVLTYDESEEEETLDTMELREKK